MTLSITLGWWLLPSLLSIAAFTWAFWDRPSEQGGYFPHLGPLFRAVGALILTLVMWIVYLLCVIAFR